MTIWRTENPHDPHHMFKKSEKETIWSALSFNEVIGHYYFDDPIVDDESYVRLLVTIFSPSRLLQYEFSNRTKRLHTIAAR